VEEFTVAITKLAPLPKLLWEVSFLPPAIIIVESVEMWKCGSVEVWELLWELLWEVFFLPSA